MNCAYRLIWNDRFGAWCVVPEIASARGKRSGGVKQCAATLLITLALGSPIASAADLSDTALPGGGQVAAGQAAISSSGAAMTINQGSQRAIINWQNFDIGSQASVSFQQPDASAVALNRVSGPTVSRIEGQLSANGQVFLVNPNGVLFGNGARVNVGGLVASTLNIRDADFLSGNYTFSGTGGSITNQGQISAAPGGYLAFIAPTITNNGSINAPQGTVAMGAGERVRLNFAGDRLVGLDVSASTIDTLITNSQAIRAEGGAILLTAAGAEAVTRSVINNTGVLEASSLTSDGGRIVLAAGSDINLGAGALVAVDGKKGGEITVQARSGTLLAEGGISARGAEGSGGTIQLLGNQVGLIAAAQVDASGTTGGGTVLVGGDYQGGNSAVQNAWRTHVSPTATIRADALQQGDGGRIIVWGDDVTRFYGKISATGGSFAGNGGFVEVSGKGYLDFNGVVDTGALNGSVGTLLLDPTNIEVVTGGAATLAQVSAFANPDLTASCAAFGGAACSRISPTTINAAAANVILQATNNIQFTNAVSLTNAGVGLTATATTSNITVNAPITTANRASSGTTGAVTLTAGGNVVLNANITTGNATVADAGGNQSAITGNIAITAGTGISGAGQLITGNAALTGAAAGTETIRSGNITLNVTGAGAVGLSGANALTIGSATGNGTGSTATTGNIATSADRINNGTAGSAIDVSYGAVAGGATNTVGSLTATTDGGAGASGEIVITSGEALRLGAINAGGGAITLDVGAATTAAGVISGTGASLTKLGAGTLTLSGANAYTGATNINAGTLALGAANLIANASAVTVAAGAKFNLANFAETVGSLAGAGSVTLGSATLTAGGDNTSTTFSGVASGTGRLTKVGNGTLTLSGNNTYGSTTISAGTLQVGAGGTTGTLGTGAVTDNGALVFNRSNTLTVTTAISGSGSLTQAGTGTTTLTANNGYTGTTTISAGTLQVGAGVTTGTLGTGAVTNNGALVFNRSNGLTVANAMSGTGTLTQAGTGTTTLTGTNTYAGTTTISAGTLQVGAGGIIGTLGTGVVTNNGALIINRSDALTVANAISGTGTLTKTNAGTLTLSGINTYTGATSINGGTLTASGGNALPDASQVTLANNAGATLNLANNETIGNLSGGGTTGGNVTLGANTLTVNEAGTTTYGGVINGTGGLTKAGAGTLTLSGANTYTGASNIAAGTLTLGNNERIADSSAVTVALGATFNLGNYGETIGSLAGAGKVTKSGATARILAVGGDNTSTTFSGLIQQTGTGALSLTKNGTGVLTLSGANTYTGATMINAGGTLVAANNTALGTAAGGTTGANGATLALQDGITVGAEALNISGTGVGGDGALRNLSGNNTLGGLVTLAANAEIQSDAGTLTLSAANSVTGATRSLSVDGAGNTTINGTITTTSGSLTKNGNGTLTLSGNNNYNGATTVNAGTLAVTANNALGTAGVGTTVASGATLDFRNVAYATAEAVMLNGGTLATSTGTSSFAGGGALSAPSFINVGGTQLTLLGAVNAPSTLTVTGGGSLTATNATNDFSTVSVTSATNVSLRDTNAINLDTSTISGNLALTANGAITQSGALAVSGTTTLAAGAANNITLNNIGNNFGTVGIVSGNNVTLVDSNALALGATSATGLLDVRTKTGDLTTTGNISTSSSAANAIVLVAGESAGAGTASGGNIIIGGGTTVSIGSGGRATLYSGSISSSTGLAALVGSGSGNFRYNSDEVTTNFSAPLGAGVYAIYREQPTVTITANSPSTITYGSAIPPLTATVTGQQNGDTLAQTFSTLATVTAGGATSTSGNLVAGNHTLTPAGAVERLGYALSYATGTLAVDKLALTGASIAGVNTTYGTPAATGAVSFTNVVGSDVVTSTASIVSSTYSTSNNMNAGSYAQTASVLGGGDANNYSFFGGVTTATNNYTVDKLVLTGSISAGDKVYDSTTAATISSRSLSGVIIGDGVSYVGGIANFSDKNVGAAKTVTASVLGLSGADAGNYTVNSVASTVANITPAPLVLNAVSDSKVYDGTTGSSGAVVAVGVQGSDSVGNLSQSYTRKNVLGINASTLTVNGGYIVNDGNGGANYSVTTTNAQGTIFPAPLTIAANDASKSFGVPNPPFSATYTGFVCGETPSVLSGVLSFQTVAGATSPPGNYAITPYGQISYNYAIVFTDGVLTINGVPTGPGDAGITGADQQAIGAQYTSQGTPNLALTKVRFILAEDECNEATATSGSGCLDRQAEGSVVRLVDGGMLMPRQ